MNCREIQDRLAEDIGAATADSRLKEHIEKCKDCAGFVRRLKEVDDALASLPKVKPSQEVIQRTVAAVERSRVRPNRRLKLVLGASVPVVVVLFLMLTVVTFKGSEIRSLFSTSADALSGNEPPEISAGSSQEMYAHKSLVKFGEGDSGGSFGALATDKPTSGSGRYLGKEGKPDPQDALARNVQGQSTGVKLGADESGRRLSGPLPVQDPATASKPQDSAYWTDSSKPDEKQADTWNRKYKPPSNRTTVETLLTGERVKA